MAELAGDQGLYTRPRLLESLGRTMALMGNQECWGHLEKAENEARQSDQVGYLNSIRSQLVAAVSGPKGGDTERGRVLGAKGLDIAERAHWNRKAEQIRLIADDGGVELASPSSPASLPKGL